MDKQQILPLFLIGFKKSNYVLIKYYLKQQERNHQPFSVIPSESSAQALDYGLIDGIIEKR